MKEINDPEFGWLGWSKCDIDHDHDRAWWCADGPSGVFKPPNIQRDVLALTAAIDRVADKLDHR